MTIDEVITKNGAFFAFSDKQFTEQKKDGIKYVSMGMGLICPKENADKLNDELSEAIKEQKKQEKEKREQRSRELKIDKLPKEERIHNRKILIAEATARIQNFMDCDYIADCVKKMYKSNGAYILDSINDILSGIAYRYHDRADYEKDIKEIYDENIEIIKGLRDEIKEII